MSAEVRDDDEGPVDREAVVSNLLMLRIEEFEGQVWNQRTEMAMKMSLTQSLRTMAMVFRITRPLPLFHVEFIPARTWQEKSKLNLKLLDAESKREISVGEWLNEKRSG